MTRLYALSVSTAVAKYQITSFDCGANEHFVCDRKVYKKYGKVYKATVNTCVGMGTIFRKGLVSFQIGSELFSLTRKNAPHFD